MHRTQGWVGLAFAFATVFVCGLGADTASAAPPDDMATLEVPFTHPTWGPSSLLVESSDSSDPFCRFSVIDRSGISRWTQDAQGCVTPSWVYEPAPDGSGNILIGYQDVRRAGVTVLRPTTDGMQDFSTLPYNGEDVSSSRGRFSDNTAYDVDGDGILEIVGFERSCDPDCATGDVSYTTFSWMEDDYYSEMCTEANWPQIPVQSSPGPGGTILGHVPSSTCGVLTKGGGESVDGGGWWSAVWYVDLVGWAPIEAFTPSPSTPPWPENYDPLSQEMIPPPPPPPTQPPPPAAPPPCGDYSFNDQYPIRRCDEGYAVYIVQLALSNLGYMIDVDGYFGPGTELAVRHFQARNGLEVDGLVGPQTWWTLVGGQPGYDVNGNGIIDPDEVIWD